MLTNLYRGIFSYGASSAFEKVKDIKFNNSGET
jgi:hypothetical protein